MQSSFEIAGRPVGHDHPPYIIAEMSANHGGDFDRAKRIIAQAAAAKADAIKFQAYTADSLTLDSDRPDFLITGESLWQGRRLYELYQSAATPYAWFPELFAYARSLGITPFATAFGLDAIEALEPLKPAAYKVASFEAVDLPLIAALAKTQRPLIISTGLCSWTEAEEALAAARDHGADKVVMLKCSSAYPADLAQSNLAAIPAMRARLGVPIGYSDHTLGTTVPIAAVALGACMVEKHVIDAREPPTADSAFSALSDELTDLVVGCREAFAARGGQDLGPMPSELGSLMFRRSIYVARDIAAGEILNADNLRVIRPGLGLAPKHLGAVIGKPARHTLVRGQALTWDDVG